MRAPESLNLRRSASRPTMQFRQTDSCRYPGSWRSVADGASPNRDLIFDRETAELPKPVARGDLRH